MVVHVKESKVVLLHQVEVLTHLKEQELAFGPFLRKREIQTAKINVRPFFFQLKCDFVIAMATKFLFKSSINAFLFIAFITSVALFRSSFFVGLYGNAFLHRPDGSRGHKILHAQL